MAETVYDIGRILEIMPHRYPFLLVDRILDVVPGESIVGLKNVTYNEEFFQGHFPRLPVMPGVLILEAMAQTGGILAWASAEEQDRNRMLYFMSIDKAKFRRPVVPGDQLIFKLSGFRASSRAIKMEAKALVDDKLAAQAQLTAAIGDVYQKN